jgi:hypothetical protein
MIWTSVTLSSPVLFFASDTSSTWLRGSMTCRRARGPRREVPRGRPLPRPRRTGTGRCRLRGRGVGVRWPACDASATFVFHRRLWSFLDGAESVPVQPACGVHRTFRQARWRSCCTQLRCRSCGASACHQHGQVDLTAFRTLEAEFTLPVNRNSQIVGVTSGVQPNLAATPTLWVLAPKRSSSLRRVRCVMRSTPRDRCVLGVAG